MKKSVKIEVRKHISTDKVIRECFEPKRYTDLLYSTLLSTRGLTIVLERLINKGILKKTKDGKYVLTQEGRQIYYEIKAHDLLDCFMKLFIDKNMAYLELKKIIHDYLKNFATYPETWKYIQEYIGEEYDMV